MPSVSQAPIFNKISHVTADHVMAPDESIASVKAMPAAGIRITLPGPSAPKSPPLPSDGDYYEVMDPKGLVGAGTPITVDGGGYNIRLAGASTATIQSIVPGSGGRFTFDDDAQLWYFCPCTWQGPV